ncbi:MAG: phosphate ABC transporter ATP-binding protein PstB [Bacillota bacterium]
MNMKNLAVKNLDASYGNTRVIKDITITFEAGKITAIIGPSGCGKSTFVRCLNRLHETVPGASLTGEVLLGEESLLKSSVDPVDVRRRVAMVFQRPNPLPARSIFENTAIGLRLNSSLPESEIAEVVEESLKEAALWDEVKNRLHVSGASLSGGQQQRLCIARALALRPEVLLLDEPCSALDPVSTMHIENLMKQLKDKLTIVIVTHNMEQAARVSDDTAFFLDGELIEYADTEAMFTAPTADRRTEEYITGRFG